VDRASWRLGRQQQHLVVTVVAAVVGGTLLAVSPTGTQFVDELWCAAFAGTLAWAGGDTRRPVLLAIAVASVVLASTGTALLLALAAVAVAAPHAVMARGYLRLNSVTSGLIALSLLAGSGGTNRWFATLTTTALTVALLTGAARATHRRRRRLMIRAGLLTGAGLVLAVALAGVAGMIARPQLETGIDAFDAAQDLGGAGQVDRARNEFEEAEQNLSRGRSTLRYLGAPGRIVPGLAQQIRAADHALDAASAAAGAGARAAQRVDLDRLQVRGGRIDLGAIEELREPVAELVAAIDDSVARIERIDRRLLLAPVANTLQQSLEEASGAARSAGHLQHAVAVLPDLLGAETPRNYLVLFTTPVEARNRFGFPGSYSLLRFDQGKLTSEDSGAIQDLFPPGRVFDQAALEVPPRARPYAGYGVANEWRSVTVPAHFPATADLAQQMARQTEVGEVDGVIMVGPRAAAAVVGLLGELELPEAGVTLTEETAYEFITVEQYYAYPERDEQEERKDLLADLAEEVGDLLAESNLPPPGDLIDLFSPLVARDQLVVGIPGFTSPETAALLAEVGLDGAMPEPPGDLLHLGHLNGSGNKIDLHLRRELTYDVTVAEDGAVAARLTVALHNRAPDRGEPRYVIGSSIGLDPGVNRSILLLYSRYRLNTLTVDGEAVEVVGGADGSYFVYQTTLDLAPGQERTLEATLRGMAEPDRPHEIHLLPNGLLRPDRTTVRLDDQRAGIRGEATPTVTAPTLVSTFRGRVAAR
jgi:hypothetical protein